MNGPEERPRRIVNEREQDVERPIEGEDRSSDVERPLYGTEAHEAEEVSAANLAMNDEFVDAGNESHLEQDAGIDEQPGDGGAVDDADTTLNSGIVNRSAG